MLEAVGVRSIVGFVTRWTHGCTRHLSLVRQWRAAVLQSYRMGLEGGGRCRWCAAVMVSGGGDVAGRRGSGGQRQRGSCLISPSAAVSESVNGRGGWLSKSVN